MPEAGDLAWSDEFDRFNETNWLRRESEGQFGKYNNEIQEYTARWENSYTEDGKLMIVARCEEWGRWFSSARLDTNRTFSKGHRFQIKAKVPMNFGSWPGLWLVAANDTDWPWCGEIDILETVGCDPGRMYGSAHTGRFNHRQRTEKRGVFHGDPTQWHTYTLDWASDKLAWYIDDVKYFTYAPPNVSDWGQWPFHDDFHLVLNVAVAGNWGGFCLPNWWPNCHPGWNNFGPAITMEVDYVRVYHL